MIATLEQLNKMNGGGQMRPAKRNWGYFIVNYPSSTCPMDGANSDQLAACVEFQSPNGSRHHLHAKAMPIKDGIKRGAADWNVLHIKLQRGGTFLYSYRHFRGSRLTLL